MSLRGKGRFRYCRGGRGPGDHRADLIYAEARQDKERTGEILRESEAGESEAAYAFKDAQERGFAKGDS